MLGKFSDKSGVNIMLCMNGGLIITGPRARNFSLSGIVFHYKLTLYESYERRGSLILVSKLCGCFHIGFAYSRSPRYTDTALMATQTRSGNATVQTIFSRAGALVRCSEWVTIGAAKVC